MRHVAGFRRRVFDASKLSMHFIGASFTTIDTRSLELMHVSRLGLAPRFPQPALRWLKKVSLSAKQEQQQTQDRSVIRPLWPFGTCGQDAVVAFL